jgi:hypothetical protein
VNTKGKDGHCELGEEKGGMWCWMREERNTRALRQLRMCLHHVGGQAPVVELGLKKRFFEKIFMACNGSKHKIYTLNRNLTLFFFL